MFLTAVSWREVVDIINKCTHKTSTDCNDIDMTVVRRAIEGISKPLTRIYNPSFLTGSFLNQIKSCKSDTML